MRPFRRPLNANEIALNQRYLNGQNTFPENIRFRDWHFPADTDLTGWPEWEGPERLEGDELLALINRADDQVNRAAAEQMMLREGLRFRGERPDNAATFKKTKMLNLDKLPPGDKIIRDVSLPPFKVEYDSHEQINTKLNNTVIMIKDNPFYISQTCRLGEGKYGLIVHDHNHTAYSVAYDDVKDCRPIAPGYVARGGHVYWMFRVPERQNQQGMNQRNTLIRPVGQGDSGQTGARWEFLLDALSNRKDCQYSASYDQLIEQGMVPALRLNNNVAIYKSGKKGAPVGVEYCGRALGLIVNGMCKVLDATDLRPSWIHKDLHNAGLALTE